jgi:hypothetical protein
VPPVGLEKLTAVDVRDWRPKPGEPLGTSVSIPVSPDCIMGVNAVGHVTQGGIDKLIAYLQLIKGSFPTNGN